MCPHRGAATATAGAPTSTLPTTCENEGPGTPARVTLGGMLFAVQTAAGCGSSRGAASGQQAVASRPLRGHPPGAA